MNDLKFSWILYSRKRLASKKVVLGNWVPHTLGPHLTPIPYSQMDPLPGPYASCLTKAKSSCIGQSATGKKNFVRRHGVVGISVGPVQVRWDPLTYGRNEKRAKPRRQATPFVAQTQIYSLSSFALLLHRPPPSIWRWGYHCKGGLKEGFF
jgi:hypothetical protein